MKSFYALQLVLCLCLCFVGRAAQANVKCSSSYRKLADHSECKEVGISTIHKCGTQSCTSSKMSDGEPWASATGCHLPGASDAPSRIFPMWCKSYGFVKNDPNIHCHTFQKADVVCYGLHEAISCSDCSS